MQLIVPEPSPLDTESDTNLLLFAAEGNKNERRLATNAFFRRYVTPLYKFCQQFQQTLGGEDGVRDLVLMTFQHAFKRAETFTDNENLDQRHGRARTLRWLAKISENLIRDWVKSGSADHPLPLTSLTNPDRKIEDEFAHAHDTTASRRYVKLTNDASENLPDPNTGRDFIDNDDEIPLPISPESQCLQEALATLTEREREIILFSAQYSIDGKQLRLPPDVLDGLCERWDTTKINLRTIRKRAYKKIKEYVAAHC